MTTSDDAVRDAMQALCGELFAAHQRLDPEAIKRLYARLPDGIYFWERALAYDFSQVAKTVDALATSVAALELTPGEFRAGGSGDVGWFALTFHARRTAARRARLRVRRSLDGGRSHGRWALADRARPRLDPTADEALAVGTARPDQHTLMMLNGPTPAALVAATRNCTQPTLPPT